MMHRIFKAIFVVALIANVWEPAFAMLNSQEHKPIDDADYEAFEEDDDSLEVVKVVQDNKKDAVQSHGHKISHHKNVNNLACPCQLIEPALDKTVMSESTWTGCVNRVYDGDTFFITLDDSSMPEVFRHDMGVRCFGFDAPEMHDHRENIQKRAQAARDFLQELLSNASSIALRFMREVRTRKIKKDKYFRLLVRVLVNGRNLADIMIDAGHAQPYFGGKKPVWD
jgi:micrococcal nuclease